MGGTVGRHPGGSEAFPNAHTPPFRHAAKHFGRRLSANLILNSARPGALLAQRWLRHKTIKRSFRIQFWATVALNLAAFVVLSPVAQAWWRP